MDVKQFQTTFQRFASPALLLEGEDWTLNPAAQALDLSPADLDRLKDWTEDDMVWLARRFFHISVGQVDGGRLYLLQPDVFLSSAAENLSSQLRERLNMAFGAVSSLSGSAALRCDLRARRDLSVLNRELYRVFRMAIQLEQFITPNPFVERVSQVDIPQWFQHLSGELGELCRKAGVTFTAESDVDELTLPANRRQLSCLVLTLASNALKSAPEEGARLALTMRRQQDQLVLTLSDNAGGFPPDYLSDPLWNAPERPIPRRGLGLGLPTAQRIAAAHRGTLMVFPSQEGTRVAVSIPLRQEDHLAQPELPIDDTPGFSMAKILLSDALPDTLYFPDPDGDDP